MRVLILCILLGWLGCASDPNRCDRSTKSVASRSLNGCSLTAAERTQRHQTKVERYQRRAEKAARRNR